MNYTRELKLVGDHTQRGNASFRRLG